MCLLIYFVKNTKTSFYIRYLFQKMAYLCSRFIDQNPHDTGKSTVLAKAPNLAIMEHGAYYCPLALLQPVYFL
jgi:hypothetical protein